MTQKEITELCTQAIKARKMAYIPYSHFAVGAALMTEDGEIFTGCNIENISYSATNCAERTAIFKAVSEGKKDFKAIAVTGGAKEREPSDYCMPCAVCRQVMQEFCSADFEVYVVKAVGDYKQFTLGELLPYAFDSLKL